VSLRTSVQSADLSGCNFFLYRVVPAISTVALNIIPLKVVADVASVADEERRRVTLRISVSTGGAHFEITRNPNRLDIGAGIDTFCRNGPVNGGYILTSLQVDPVRSHAP